MKPLKILAIIAVIWMVVGGIRWFVLFKERKELEGLLGERYRPVPEEEIDLEEVRRIFEEEGYMEEGQYSPSPDEEYPSLPLGEQKEHVGLKKGNLLGNLAEIWGKFFQKLFGSKGILAQTNICPFCQKYSEGLGAEYKIIGLYT